MGTDILNSAGSLFNTVARGFSGVVNFFLANPWAMAVGLFLVLTSGKSLSIGNLFKVKG